MEFNIVTKQAPGSVHAPRGMGVASDFNTLIALRFSFHHSYFASEKRISTLSKYYLYILL